ncbi:hypothetical protein E3P99_01002 [Wallemia hederae]|uniref:Uncharacterized protein n=1 Tax=Wallemia hederae TaxID=1540922 RepID=A0A4T0FX48_9BASI|nr:hypothetical protein E3P99_01002 [Wallemia hederae]
MDGLHVEIKSDKYYYFAGDLIRFTLRFSNIQSESPSQPSLGHHRSLSTNGDFGNLVSSGSSTSSSSIAHSPRSSKPSKPLPTRCGLVGKITNPPQSDSVPQGTSSNNIGKGRPSPLRHNRNVHSIDYTSPTSKLSKRFSSDTLNNSNTTPSQHSSPSKKSPQSPTRSPSLPSRHPHQRKASSLSTPTTSSSTMQDNSSYSKMNRNLRTPLLPNHEKILWATAQMSGKVELNGTLIKRSSMNAGRSSKVVGGGVLDDGKKKHSVGVGGHHKRSSTLFNFNLSNWFNQVNNSSHSNDTSNTTMSIWETRRSVLVVDKVLSPNRDVVITYQHTLPKNLPPSYQGKIGKISYEFVVGTNKQQGSARVIKVPIKVLPNVTVDEEMRKFNILSPLIEINEEAVVFGGDNGSNAADALTPTLPSNQKKCFEKAYSYAQKLYSTTHKSIQRSSSTHSSGYDGTFEHVELGARVSEQCRTAIGISSRNSQKVTYEITKDDLNIAVLSVVKSTFRLGESVLGKISINKPNTVCGKVLKFSATLESHEIANEEYANLSQKHTVNATRKVHSEFHQPLAIDLSEVGFSLDVPSHQSSDFKTSIFEVKWIIKLSFLILIPILVEDTQAYGSSTASLSPRPSIGSSMASSPLPTPTLQPMPRTPFTSSSTTTSTPTSPSTTNLGNGYHVKNVNHLVGVEHSHNTFRAQDRLGGGDGKGREEVIQCQIPINILPNSTDYEPEPCTITL